MDEAIKIENDVTVKVFNCFGCEFAADLLNLLYVIESILLKKFLFEELGLLVKVIGLKLGHEMLNLNLFVFDQIIEGNFHPHEHSISFTAFFLNMHVFFSVEEVILLFELIP